MDFIITKEQKSMQKAAREFLKAKCQSQYVRDMENDESGYTQEFWRQIAELDWMAFIIPDKYGGLSYGLFDFILLLEEMGRTCMPGPYLNTMIGAHSIVLYGTEAQKNKHLPSVAKGNQVITMAILEPTSTVYNPYTVSAISKRTEEHYIVEGIKLFVPDAQSADIIICSVNAPDKSRETVLLLIDRKLPGVEIHPLKTISGDKQFEVVLKQVRIQKECVLGNGINGGRKLEKILQFAAVCKCAEMVGGASKVLEMCTAYSKDRKQFGKPIGSFQAVQHHCANMLIDLEGSRYITYKAAWMLDNNIPCEKEIAVAKAFVSEAFKRITSLGHQVQGGAAFMNEHDMQLFSRRSITTALSFGDATFHRKKIAKLIGLNMD